MLAMMAVPLRRPHIEPGEPTTPWGVTGLRVNGSIRDVRTHPRSPLRWALRDELGCASVRYGCGVGQCGACRVLLDGGPALSCEITVGDADGHDITTLEALVADGTAGPAVDAVLGLDAGQCGYCLPGIVVALTALRVRSDSAPTRDEVVRALDAHLCRCGAQPRILAAAFEALGVDDG
jgi:nicotinate dehydrogenase subunit A